MKFILSIIIIIAIAGIAFVWFSRIPATNILIIQNSKGEAVTVKNFYEHPIERFGEDAVVARSDEYEIVYYAKDKSFIVVIRNKPAQNARDAAEQAFLRALDISQKEACKLSVQLSVMGSVDLDLAGKDYGLSFCPHGIVF